MNEWLRGVGPAVGNHLWQTTAFVAVVWAMTLALRKNQARVRYGLWLAASVKFVVPFALLIGLGGMLPRPQRVVAAPVVYSTVDEVTQPFSEIEYGPVVVPVMSWKERVEARLPVVVAVVWLCGMIVVLVVWAVRWRQVWLTLRLATDVECGREFELLRRVERAMGLPARVGLRMSRESMEPGIFGFLRPTLMWPEGLSERLDDEHIAAILIHELTHVRRRDNLTAALHMVVEAAFWFHPLVWWMERRMVEERERACDETVVALGSRPGVYADGLLKAVRFCVESPLTCVAGITGADLNMRVRSIMTLRRKKLGIGGKVALAAAAIGVIAGPIVLGQAKAAERMMLAAVQVAPMPFRAAARAMLPLEETPSTGEIAEVQDAAQSAPGKDGMNLFEDNSTDPEFEVAVIRPTDPNSKDGGSWVNASGRFEGHKTTLQGLINFAYVDWIHGSPDAVSGGPDWAQHEHFDVEAKVSEANLKGWQGLTDSQRIARVQPMLRRLLAERFHLKLHTETKTKDVFALVQVKGGAKLKEVAPPPPVVDDAAQRQAIRDSMAQKAARPVPGSFMMSGDGWSGTSIAITMLLNEISGNAHLGAPLIDQTGLRGFYDFTMKVSHDSDAPLLIDQVQTELGLKVEPRKLPMKIYVIDSAEKPSVDGAEVLATPQESPAETAIAAPVILPEMRFDVASIRPSPPDARFMYPPRGTAEDFSARMATVESMIGFAYDIPVTIGMSADPAHFFLPHPLNITGAPAWVNNDRYDLTAKAGPETVEAWSKLSKDQQTEELRGMMRALLAERFHLTMRHETRQMPVWALVVAKGGPKFKETAGAPTDLNDGLDPARPYDKSKSYRSRWKLGPGMIQGQDVTIGNFDGMLGSMREIESRKILDQTGLTGKYDVTLKWASVDEPQETDGPSLFTAIQEQLGLKLESTKAPMDVVVIDHIDRPSAN